MQYGGLVLRNGLYNIELYEAKRALWDSKCSTALLEAGLSFQPRRGSEKCSQAAADLDDMLIAFEKLDDVDKVPDIYCEAADLVQLPPIVADACMELVQHNSSSLEIIKGKLDSLSQGVLDLSSQLGSVQSRKVCS